MKKMTNTIQCNTIQLGISRINSRMVRKLIKKSQAKMSKLFEWHSYNKLTPPPLLLRTGE